MDQPSQAALLKAAEAAESRGWKISEEKNQWYLNALKEKGMTIHKPSAKLQADLKQVGQSMQADWVKKAGADGQAIVDTYNKK